jgi:UDP-glucose 4-epimerase
MPGSLIIIGDAGYIGTHLKRLLPGWEGCDLKRGEDYRDIKGRSFSSVIHLAALVSVMGSFEKPEEYYQNNAAGLWDFLQGNKIGRLVFISTGGLYGNRRMAGEQDADFANCRSPYTRSKLQAELIVQYLHANYVILRLANVYGGDCGMRGEAAVHNHFENDSPITIYGGDQTRDFVHVDTVCKAIVRALDAPNGTYNIGSGIETGIRELAEEYSKKRGVPAEIRPKRNGEVDFISLDCTRAKEAGLLL